MYTIPNHLDAFKAIINGYDDPMEPLLRHNVLCLYRTLLGHMVTMDFSDEFIMEYLKRHEELMVINDPQNSIEQKHNEEYLAYAYSKSSMRTFFAMIDSKNKATSYPKTLQLIFDKVLEHPKRYLCIPHIAVYKRLMNGLNTNPLVIRYFIESDNITNKDMLSQANKHNLINNYVMYELFDYMLTNKLTIPVDYINECFNYEFFNIPLNEKEKLENRVTLLNLWNKPTTY